MTDDRTLQRYLDGELPAAEAGALERDAQREPALAARLDELRLLGDAVRDGAPAPPPGFANRIAAAARLRGASPPPAEVLDLRRFARRALVAAALLAALGLSYLALDVVPDIVTKLQAKPDPLLEVR